MLQVHYASVIFFNFKKKKKKLNETLAEYFPFCINQSL